MGYSCLSRDCGLKDPWFWIGMASWFMIAFLYQPVRFYDCLFEMGRASVGWLNRSIISRLSMKFNARKYKIDPHLAMKLCNYHRRSHETNRRMIWGRPDTPSPESFDTPKWMIGDLSAWWLYSYTSKYIPNLSHIRVCWLLGMIHPLAIQHRWSCPMNHPFSSGFNTVQGTSTSCWLYTTISPSPIKLSYPMSHVINIKMMSMIHKIHSYAVSIHIPLNHVDMISILLIYGMWMDMGYEWIW